MIPQQRRLAPFSNASRKPSKQMEEGHNSGGSHPAQAGQNVPVERMARPEYQSWRYFAPKRGILQPAEGTEGRVKPVALHPGCDRGSVPQLCAGGGT